MLHYKILATFFLFLNQKTKLLHLREAGIENDVDRLLFSSLDYLGCYRDDKEKGRDLPFRPQTRTHNRGDALSCVLNCAESGFVYAGLQNGNLCFCGNKYGSYGRVSDQHCNLKCLQPIGIQKQSVTEDVFNSCGGKWVNSIYSGMLRYN